MDNLNNIYLSYLTDCPEKKDAQVNGQGIGVVLRVCLESVLLSSSVCGKSLYTGSV